MKTGPAHHGVDAQQPLLTLNPKLRRSSFATRTRAANVANRTLKLPGAFAMPFLAGRVCQAPSQRVCTLSDPWESAQCGLHVGSGIGSGVALDGRSTHA